METASSTQSKVLATVILSRVLAHWHGQHEEIMYEVVNKRLREIEAEVENERLALFFANYHWRFRGRNLLDDF